MTIPEQPYVSQDFPVYLMTSPACILSPIMTIRPKAPLRIAQVSPLYESVPPKLYGGTERVVSYLTEELVALGHDVTLFASGDSKTAARLVPVARCLSA